MTFYPTHREPTEAATREAYERGFVAGASMVRDMWTMVDCGSMGKRPRRLDAYKTERAPYLSAQQAFGTGQMFEPVEPPVQMYADPVNKRYPGEWSPEWEATQKAAE